MKRKPLIIGVAGGTASGKTTIANAIMESINHPQMVMIQHDAYYKDASHLPLAERARINFDHPDSLETDLMVRHLRELIAGRAIEMPVYDFSTHARLEKGIVKKPAKVIIIEGILIFCEQALRDLMDVKIFVDTDSDLRFIRRLEARYPGTPAQHGIGDRPVPGNREAHAHRLRRAEPQVRRHHHSRGAQPGFDRHGRDHDPPAPARRKDR